jgi:hypothetical protein
MSDGHATWLADLVVVVLEQAPDVTQTSDPAGTLLMSDAAGSQESGPAR